jgi:hypothetical protein
VGVLPPRHDVLAAMLAHVGAAHLDEARGVLAGVGGRFTDARRAVRQPRA